MCFAYFTSMFVSPGAGGSVPWSSDPDLTAQCAQWLDEHEAPW